jgi:Nucleotidyl transferase AbiEii toxin, Type IV TA system
VREIRADHYGIRTMLKVDDAEIKLEIVLEGRVTFDEPAADDRICGVATLTPLDMATSKLLAHSDRWRDDAMLSRDLIDLAMMAPPKKLLKQAIADLRQRPQRLDHCMQRMRMTTIPTAVLWARIKALGSVLSAT